MSELAVVVPAYNEQGITDTLSALNMQNVRIPGIMHYIVDNGSTDNTRELIEEFGLEHPDFPLTVVEESEKGTGFACDTGFRTAIADGYQVIARTDADTVPNADWTSRIVSNFRTRPDLQLLAGKSVPARDEYYRPGDDRRRAIGVFTTLLLKGIVAGNPGYLYVAIGHNMATRAGAYIAVDGFPRMSILDGDEDAEYSLRIHEKYGKEGFARDPGMVVASSERRAREYGMVLGCRYYLFPHSRHKILDNPDVR